MCDVMMWVMCSRGRMRKKKRKKKEENLGGNPSFYSGFLPSKQPSAESSRGNSHGNRQLEVSRGNRQQVFPGSRVLEESRLGNG